MRHGKETPTLAKDVLYVTLSVLYVPAQNFKMKNKATSAYYSRVFNRRCNYSLAATLAIVPDCTPKAIPVQNLDRSASNSRVSTAAVEACYIIRYKLCERNMHQAQTTMLKPAPYCSREIFIQLGVEPLLRTGIEIGSTIKIRIKRIA